jgi:hypothetical protein
MEAFETCMQEAFNLTRLDCAGKITRNGNVVQKGVRIQTSWRKMTTNLLIIHCSRAPMNSQITAGSNFRLLALFLELTTLLYKHFSVCRQLSPHTHLPSSHVVSNNKFGRQFEQHGV